MLALMTFQAWMPYQLNAFRIVGKSRNNKNTRRFATQESEPLFVSRVSVTKPMGLILEEIVAADPASGVRVAFIDPKGNAGRLTT